METPATSSALIGAPVLLLVAEPWDFTSAYGRGRLQGQISNIRDFGVGGGPGGVQEVWIAVTPLVIAGHVVEGLRATPLRHAEGDLARRLLERRSVAVRLLGPEGSGVRLAAAIRRLGPGRPQAEIQLARL